MNKLRERIATFLARFFGGVNRAVGKKPAAPIRILCDTCRYNHGNVCVRPERPNATECPEYQRMGGRG